MKTATSTILFLAFFVLTQASCVSVQLGPKAPEKAKKVSFSAPTKPFEEIEVQDVDNAWKNPNNGNSISFRTMCNDPVESEIESIQQSIKDGLDASKTEFSQVTQYNGREALRSIIQGKLDGVATKIEVMVFKKNNCTYAINYIALPKNFDKDRGVFETFLKGFVAP